VKAIWVFAVLLSFAIAMPVLVLAETPPNIGYGPSPSQAVRRAFQIDQIVRVNIVEPYAIVSARGKGPLFDDGSPTEFLLEHFDFGWQVLEMARALCTPERGITPAAARSLMAGMPKQSANGVNCDELDSGPARSVAQVRRLMNGPVVPFVRVADNYAYSVDFGDGGGCGLFHFDAVADRWKILGGCKGAMDPTVIERNHIPQEAVCAIRPAVPEYLKCPRKTQPGP
jgi:hypothetical protein